MLAKEEGRILVISKYGLEFREFNLSYEAVTWETCSLRKWLNGTFLNSEFLSEEQDRIPTVTVTADENLEYDISPGNSTADKVFLLSIKEVNKYFGSNSARECQGTEYSNAQLDDKIDENCFWWLRSPGYDQRDAAYVSSYGASSGMATMWATSVSPCAPLCG